MAYLARLKKAPETPPFLAFLRTEQNALLRDGVQVRRPEGFVHGAVGRVGSGGEENIERRSCGW